MTTTKRRSNDTAAFVTCALVVLALSLLMPADVKAQTTTPGAQRTTPDAPWTTADVNQNISNTNTGNVGIGTSSPASPAGFVKMVHLYNALAASYVVDAGGTARAEFGVSSSGGWLSTADVIPLRFATSNSERMRIDPSGNVGIGTTNPWTNFQVNGKAQIASTTQAVFVDPTSVLQLMTASGTGGSLTLWQSGAAAGAIGSKANDSNFYFSNLYNNGLGTPSTSIALTNTGNVGIGITTPASGYKLDVNGNTNVTGNLNATSTITGNNIIAKYQDVAEWVQSSQTLPAGTVVVLDHTKSNQVIASSQSYDTRVAGVVSARPGIALGESGESNVLGRVRVKVDASGGAIHIGDLLVTSDKEGFAMKSEPVLIGKRQMHSPARSSARHWNRWKLAPARFSCS